MDGTKVVGNLGIRECLATVKKVYLYLKSLGMTIQRIDNQVAISFQGSIGLEGL